MPNQIEENVNRRKAKLPYSLVSRRIWVHVLLRAKTSKVETLSKENVFKWFDEKPQAEKDGTVKVIKKKSRS